MDHSTQKCISQTPKTEYLKWLYTYRANSIVELILLITVTHVRVVEVMVVTSRCMIYPKRVPSASLSTAAHLNTAFLYL